MRTVIRLLTHLRLPGRRRAQLRAAGPAAVLVATLAAATGCGVQQVGPPAGSPSVDVSDVGRHALLIGHLVGDPRTGCVGVTDVPDVRDPWGSPVIWPPGVQPRTDPVRLLGPNGDVIAREGDVVHLGGGSTADQTPPQPPCTERPSFVANEIIKVEPGG